MQSAIVPKGDLFNELILPPTPKGEVFNQLTFQNTEFSSQDSPLGDGGIIIRQ